MTRTEALVSAKANLKGYLHSQGWKEGGDCPICGHKGCFSVEPSGYRWTCFSSKHEGIKHGDVFDLYASMNGLPDGKAAEVLEAVYREFGYTVEASYPKGREADRREEVKKMAEITEAAQAAKKDREAESSRLAEERRKFIEAAALAIGDGKYYLDQRGISLETAKEYRLGYASSWRSPAALRRGKTPPISSRLIIPNDEGGYLARDTRKVIPSEADGYAKQKEGNSSTFGLSLLSAEDTSPVFVVEGEIDALSIVEAGGRAVALGSVANVKKLISGLNLKRTAAAGKFSPRLILALDQDEAGEKATAELSALLSADGYGFSLANVETLYNGLKDANEALVSDREGFKSRVSSSLQASEAEAEAVRQIKESQYRQAYATNGSAADFSSMLDTERKTISSGFPSLDKALSGWKSGGLPVGLYVLGAISSLGKTTFVLQIADQMAAAGQDVLIFSLEMSRIELIGKSISRWTLKEGRSRNLAGLALQEVSYTWGDIRDMAKKINLGIFDLTDKAAVKDSAERYFSSIGSRVFIYEGGLNGTTVEAVEAAVRKHKENTGKAPVVFIDYLQVLAAPKSMETATDKTITDFKIRALKVLSRDYDTPVIAISSFNRESYYKPVSLTSFKESGLIEYSADVILGLQYKGMDEIGGGDSAEVKGRKIVDEAKSSDTRKVEVKILKNRSGGMKDSPLFSFLAPFNYFEEIEPNVDP